MFSFIKSHKKSKLLMILTAIIICLAIWGGLNAINAFAGTDNSDKVSRVFFYTTDTNEKDVFISSATIDELKNSSYYGGNKTTNNNYYASLVDAMPAVTYMEGKGITIPDFIKYMTGKSSVANADKISFDAGDDFGCKMTDAITAAYSPNSYNKLYGATRYYYQGLYEAFSDNVITETEANALQQQAVEMPVYLGIETAGGRVMYLSDEIAANGGKLTGCLANSLTSEDALRLVVPMSAKDLYDEGSTATTANQSKKWICQIRIKDSNPVINSQGTVAKPKCKMVLDGTTLKITFSCDTEGAEIYHSLDIDGDSVYYSTVPENEYDGKTIEIKNYDASNPQTIYFRAVKEGYSDAGIITVNTGDYELPTVDSEPNFIYALNTESAEFTVDESVKFSAGLTADSDCKVYGMEYQVKVPAAYFKVDSVKVVPGWQYGIASVGDNKVLTFICLNTDGIDLQANKSLDFAEITLTPLTTGNAEITIGEKVITKQDSSVYANINGNGVSAEINGKSSEEQPASVWDGTADYSWYNRTDTEFHIQTAEELAGLAYIVNQGEKLQLDGESAPQQEFFTGKTIYLDNDIYLNEHKLYGEDSNAKQWISIAGGDATNDNGAIFDGTFDGQNHTVYNMYIYTNVAHTEYLGRNRGLFGITAECATIKNVTVQDGYIKSNRSLGAIVGKTGCLRNDSYDSTRDGDGTNIINCHNVNTTIIGTDSKGTGGICGSAWNYSVIRQCSNSGSVSNTSSYPAGGIAGENEYLVEECFNTGNISAGRNAGGIVGSNKTGISEINNCYNTGKITGTNAGGITGYQVGKSANCYNAGEVSGTQSGAVFGQQSSALSNSNNYYLNTATVGIGDLTIGDDSTTAVDSDRLKALAPTLGSAYVDDTTGINSGYPILKWQKTDYANIEYAMVLESSQASVKAGDTFKIKVILTADDIADFGGAQGVISYDSKYVKYIDGNSNDGFEFADNNGKITFAGYGEPKAVNGGKYIILSLNFKALDDLTGTNNAVFGLSEALVAINGLPVGKEVESTGVTVSVVGDEAGGGGGGAIGGGDIAAETYLVTFMDGDSKLDSKKVEAGKTVSKPNDPVKDYYNFKGWYTDKECTKAYDFSKKVNGDLILYAGWIPHNCLAFTDIDGHWARDSICFVVENNLFNGTSNTLFSPNSNMTRAMLVTVLWRLEGRPIQATDSNFTDVVAGSYYEEAVDWANANGIVKGISETQFAPNDNVLREQIAAIMARYAQYKGYDVADRADLSQYADSNAISQYAYENMQWCCANGLINGDVDNKLMPQGNATRAEVAAILDRFVNNITK